MSHKTTFDALVRAFVDIRCAKTQEDLQDARKRLSRNKTTMRKMCSGLSMLDYDDSLRSAKEVADTIEYPKVFG